MQPYMLATIHPYPLFISHLLILISLSLLSLSYHRARGSKRRRDGGRRRRERIHRSRLRGRRRRADSPLLTSGAAEAGGGGGSGCRQRVRGSVPALRGDSELGSGGSSGRRRWSGCRVRTVAGVPPSPLLLLSFTAASGRVARSSRRSSFPSPFFFLSSPFFSLTLWQCQRGQDGSDACRGRMDEAPVGAAGGDCYEG